MKILEEILQGLKDEEVPVRRVLVGAFWTLVGSRRAGLASTFREDHPHEAPPVRQAGTLEGRPAGEVARLALSDSLLEASIGMAAINSLLEVDEGKLKEQNAFGLLAEKGAGKDVAIVGHFPFVDELRKVARRLFVLEQHPRQGDLPAHEAQEVLPRCQVIGITGTAFINHTLEGLLSLCPEDSFVMLIGPTTPLTPLLFDHGIAALSGSLVVDEGEALRYIAQGATFRQLHRHGIRLVTMTKDR
ncbi:MAG: hypothetical protein DRG55_01325 [Deltaproteobacteria bacterium]|nr:MAG: hypothetical protein DRG69_02685 [Deltaproteobacteria bacterium]RLB03022.1 MAG: hypothetical protein DRG55_01325 [Deltaproteobacteria bacterium]